MTLDGSPTKV
ncbi:hypothetical protein YPPY58_2240, partial [Yersinia pestis PY-58]